jgi:hypothetical protein
MTGAEKKGPAGGLGAGGSRNESLYINNTIYGGGRQVRPERTGWRDLAMSLRHRAYGFDCPAVDIDFLMLEYDTGKPIAFIEHKKENAEIPEFGHPSFRAITYISDIVGIPFFLVVYRENFTEFMVRPINARAAHILPELVFLTEIKYVKFLYSLRNRPVPAEVIARLQGGAV